MAKEGSELAAPLRGGRSTLNSAAPWPEATEARRRVLHYQRKLHRWAKADPAKVFDDIHNLVCDPATLQVAWERVRSNKGSRTAGLDGHTARDIERRGVEVFLSDLRADLKARTFMPLPVRERVIPKADGKVRRLGIATIRDRVVQAALKLVLEPIFEASFQPCSYGFRPQRRAQDAVTEIVYLNTRGYEWVIEADIEAFFDRIEHRALMARVCQRIGDRRVVGLVKAFLRAGIMTEAGLIRGQITGTPQGGILSPLLANIALSCLDDHIARRWAEMGSSQTTRWRRQQQGHATYRVVRYADDFVVLVRGTRAHAEAMVTEIGAVLEEMALALSSEKTSIT
ncbi:MAG: group II intron reverse transcriptase/maturase, partial [Actinobacteria bacterium]|nr:group II intron reverse transcriptase/maturase [Actinomycetota bacterium]